MQRVLYRIVIFILGLFSQTTNDVSPLAQNDEVKFLLALKQKLKQAYLCIEKERQEKDRLNLKISELESQVKHTNFKVDLHSSIEKDISRQRSLTIKKNVTNQEIQTEEIILDQSKINITIDKIVSTDHENSRDQAIEGEKVEYQKLRKRNTSGNMSATLISLAELVSMDSSTIFT
jgi:hypothetical protein